MCISGCPGTISTQLGKGNFVIECNSRNVNKISKHIIKSLLQANYTSKHFI